MLKKKQEIIEFLKALKRYMKYSDYHIKIPLCEGTIKYIKIDYGINKTIRFLEEIEKEG